MRVLLPHFLSPAPISPSTHVRQGRPSLQRGCGLDFDGLGLNKRGDPGEGDPTGASEDVLARSFAGYFTSCTSTRPAAVVHLPRQAIGSRRTTTSPPGSRPHPHRPPNEEGAGNGSPNHPQTPTTDATYLSCQRKLEVWFFHHGDGCTITSLLVHTHASCAGVAVLVCSLGDNADLPTPCVQGAHQSLPPPSRPATKGDLVRVLFGRKTTPWRHRLPFLSPSSPLSGELRVKQPLCSQREAA
ncbi:hypothetical protein CVT26_007759 [Gymnopilus dilepis]|uniref:Uncharacterized protein n=1 Tax=Gymnopilus dilepis TaxID=231916 RepID=A0A409X862_9AGAR|nr:hypothetical protein CVT26_007759 [Gymnopilus dilepis]